MIEIKNLRKSFGELEVLKGIDLSVQQGEVISIIGASGSGKSTLLYCINGLEDIQGGQILVDGVDVHAKSTDMNKLRQKIGMVFQQPNPFPKSIYENIAFGARINGYNGDMDELVEKSLRQAAIWDECKDKLKESGCSLSGGQQQRLCIARTIATQPEVILMDEPCSALDPIST